jgi:hypothetical protein
MERRSVDVAKKKPKKKKPSTRAKSAPPPAAPTVVQLRFQNERAPTMAKAKGKDGRTLHGAALAAHNRAHGRKGGHKGGRKTNPGGAPQSNPRRPRRRNPKTTFVQALVKVGGAAAAMFGSGVIVTLGTAKLESSWASKAATYVLPVAAVGLGAAVATKYPLVGAGVAAGGAAPFVLPVSSRMLQPAAPAATGTAGLRAVAMGSTWRSLSSAQRMNAVRMGAVSMGRALHAT